MPSLAVRTPTGPISSGSRREGDRASSAIAVQRYAEAETVIAEGIGSAPCDSAKRAVRKVDQTELFRALGQLIAYFAR